MDNEMCAQCSDFMRCFIEGREPSEYGLCMENYRDDDECDEMDFEESEATDGQGQ
jgi:hypothetical protein